MNSLVDQLPFDQNTLILLVLLIVFAAAVKIITLWSKAPEKFPFQKNEKLLTAAESKFFEALDKAIGENYRIFVKVRLADAITVKSGLGKSEWQKAFNQISAKHVDFLICDHSLNILAAVELDDKSQGRKGRRRRDQFFENAMEAAQIPLHRFPVQQSYNATDLAEQLDMR